MLVTIALPLGWGYFRSIVRGVARYRPRQLVWELNYVEFGKVPAAWLAPGNGLITLAHDLASQHRLMASPVTTVNISAHCETLLLPSVISSNHRIGQLAAEHLLALGHEHLVTLRYATRHSRERSEGFAAAIARAGRSCLTLDGQISTSQLANLPKPCGILAPNDQAAAYIVRAARRADVRVPEDIAVVGVDNDDLECLVNKPPLTSVDPAAERIGYEAAALLERLMIGQVPPQRPILIDPAGVIVRESSNVVALADVELAKVVRAIHTRATQGLAVRDLVSLLNISRRSLEVRFRRHFGRSMREEIRRTKLHYGRHLLATSDLKLLEIVRQSGYANNRSFSREFHRMFGEAPIAYQRRVHP